MSEQRRESYELLQDINKARQAKGHHHLTIHEVLADYCFLAEMFDKEGDDFWDRGDRPLPHIEEVIEVFQGYQRGCLRVTQGLNPGSWEKEFEKLRESLKRRFTELGLAIHIDWEREED